MSSLHGRLLANATTELPPCALQVHPTEDSLVIAGTYKLEEESRTRYGSLDVYEYAANGLEKVFGVQTKSSILDVKFVPSDPGLLITAQSTGSIILWKFILEEKRIDLVQEFQLFDEDVLVTSVVFNGDSDLVSATLTSGQVALVKFAQGSMEVVGMSDSHSLECWISSFGSAGLSNVVFSGGDDCMLVAHDVRTFDESPIWSKRVHDAGVTSILPSSANWLANSPETLWTGGYDDTLRSIDLRTTQDLQPYHIPRVKSSTNLGGGVWKLVPSPVANDDRVLVCCMYGGARIVSPDLEVVRTFEKGHESMVYGCDWARDARYVVSCSFYDKQMNVWSPNDTQ
ncbi:diphthine methyltransferase [Trichomonascus vanleenenianus]|uniref:diphthamide synthase n=1 Tax=Trichomonascus vanleenenianus TaxID=2268995 RepID=UPI003ECB4D9C